MIEISMEYTDLTHGFTFALLHTYTTYITYLCYFDGVQYLDGAFTTVKKCHFSNSKVEVMERQGSDHQPRETGRHIKSIKKKLYCLYIELF